MADTLSPYAVLDVRMRIVAAKLDSAIERVAYHEKTLVAEIALVDELKAEIKALDDAMATLWTPAEHEDEADG